MDIVNTHAAQQPWHGDVAALRPIRLSVAAPAYNEEAGIVQVIEGWFTFLRKSVAVAEFEIVVCNDGSRDGTGQLLHSLAEKNRELYPLDLAQNQGAAVALATAIRATRFDWVMLVDSDGQFPIESLLALLSASQRYNARAVIGVRVKKDTLFARFGTWSSGFACNLLYQTKLKDFNSACKLIDGPLLRSLTLEAKGMNYSTEVTARLLECGIHIAETEIPHLPRRSGTSSMRALKGAVHRLLFVTYLANRRLLLRLGVLQRPKA
jgi:dolichol-phosphate mannosyltransferase